MFKLKVYDIFGIILFSKRIKYIIFAISLCLIYYTYFAICEIDYTKINFKKKC